MNPWNSLEERIRLFAQFRGLDAATLPAPEKPPTHLSATEKRAWEKRRRKGAKRAVEQAAQTARARPSLPWDLSEDPAPGETGTAAQRSPEGREIGEQLARFVDIEEPKQLVRFPRQLPRCDDCAFRRGTLPNENLSTQLDALKCVVEGEPFFCHKGVAEGAPPKRLCSGWGVLTSADCEPLRDGLAAAVRGSR